MNRAYRVKHSVQRKFSQVLFLGLALFHTRNGYRSLVVIDLQLHSCVMFIKYLPKRRLRTVIRSFCD